MPPRDWKLRVDDILAAIERIQQAISGISFEQFREDQDRIEIVAFNFIKIGEAASHLPDHVTDRLSEIDWKRASQMRNFLAHVYWGISPSLMWVTAHDDLPPMLEPLRQLLAQPDRE